MSATLAFDCAYDPPAQKSSRQFAVALVVLATTMALLAGWAPLGVSIVTVLLFAAPHNWFEARYFLARMPARWGALRAYFLTGIVGVVGLTTAFIALPGRVSLSTSSDAWCVALATWNSLLVVWIVALATMRAGQNPRRRWAWLTPVAGALIALAWAWPVAWDLALVYVHPVLALWFLDRELGRQHSAWRRAYRRALPIVPLLLAVLWWRLADSPDLAGTDALSARITAHAGAGIIRGVSTHLLVALHVFLESLHYAVWLVAIPLVAIGTTPWRIDQVPLARRGEDWRNLVVAILCVGALVVVAFWAGFASAYPLTRDVYFTVAMIHVLAEVPFLLRLL